MMSAWQVTADGDPQDVLEPSEVARRELPPAPKPRSPILHPSSPVPLAEIGAWHDEADVLIVGYGGAGACAPLVRRAVRSPRSERAEAAVVGRLGERRKG